MSDPILILDKIPTDFNPSININNLQIIYDKSKSFDINITKTGFIKKINESKKESLLYKKLHSNISHTKFVKNFRNQQYGEHYDLMKTNIEDREDLDKLIYDNDFIPLDVIHHSETVDLHFIQYENENTYIKIYYIDKKPNIDIITLIISFFRNLTNNNDLFKLIVFYGNQKKQIPEKCAKCAKCLYTENVNSGSCIPTKIIYIFRKSEFFKVLIHEIIHFYRLDYYKTDEIYDKIELINKKEFQIEGTDCNNESYTETFATIIHSLLVSKIKNVDMKTILKNEYKFFHLELAKIMNFFDMENTDELKQKKYIKKQMFFLIT